MLNSTILKRNYLQSSNELYSTLNKIIQSSTVFSFNNEKDATKHKILEFYHYLYSDILSSKKFFISSTITKTIYESNLLEQSNVLKLFESFTNIQKSMERIAKNRLKEEKNKYIFDYYFYFINVFSEYIYYEYTTKSKAFPLLIGIQSPQGCGKTTICELLVAVLEVKYNFKVRSISTDDYYKPYSKLVELKNQSPYFKFRGPPGTHDVDLLYETLMKFKESKSGYHLEKFDKNLNAGNGDRVSHSSENFIKEPLDILICEGWFNGVMPLDEKIVKNDFDELIKNKSSIHLNISQEEYINTLKFKYNVNNNLNEYIKLWDLFDDFFMFVPENYSLSKTWRTQTEKEKGGLNENEISDFINYFWTAISPTIYFDKMLETNFNIKSKKCGKTLNPIKLYIDSDRNLYV